MLRLRLILVCLLALAFAAPASAARRGVEQPETGERIARFARTFVGVPYRWGGTSPRTGFDCSGFVAYVYRRFGVSLPHYTVSQFGRGRRVARRFLRPGDLVFFSGLGHVGIYVGRGRFVHAPHSGARVRVDRLRGYSTFVGARRLVRR